ncbi:unnamed protein product [Arctia plantaginis]|uniref:Regulatory protein zeste n=1 Tax=Arctia plantaginis TaxID=874455 RepID=A0A8S0ZD63_ARCPL|nr:unnamed protein product [Arctia plantaginis]
MNNRKRCVYPTAKQKKKLLEFMTKYPDLALGKLTPTFKYNDAQKLWVIVANECNAIPGSRKTWRQWRKTWQDIKSKTKKRHENGFSRSLFNLTDAEQQAIGIKLETSTSQDQESTEFVNSDALDLESAQGSFIIEDESNVSYYEVLESPTVEEEVEGEKYTNKVENNIREDQNFKENSDNVKHSNTCVFNCNLLAKHEKRKLEIKEDYINFRKDYLKQKLQLMKEQTNALKMIAKELSNK